MNPSVKNHFFRIIVALMAAVVSLTGLGAYFAPALAQDVDLQNCTLLYAVQPGDDLSSIAARFGSTEDELRQMNASLNQAAQQGQADQTDQQSQTDQQNQNRVFPGLVLCVSTDATPVLPGMEAADTGTETGTDAGTDTSTETGTDTGTDAGTDTGTDAGTDTGTDTGTEAGQAGQNGRVSATYANCSVLYAVQTGDDLSSIAGRFGSSEEQLLQSNPFLNQAGADDQSGAVDQAGQTAQAELFPGLVLCVSGDLTGAADQASAEDQAGAAADQAGTDDQTGAADQSGAADQAGEAGQDDQQGQTGQDNQDDAAQQAQTDEPQPQEQADGQQNPTDIPRGNLGVFSPFTLGTGRVTVEKIGRTSAPFAPVRWLAPVLEITAEEGPSTPTALTYVYFEVPRSAIERNRGATPQIWYQSLDGGAWQTCNTFVVNPGVEEEDEDEPARTRYGCAVPIYNAVYGLGVADE